ncbi:MAG TPA: hypothetical protein VFU69_14360, partial [Ktedonobacterales bacterium]|nr:hypothetical protein [Ktedonobacterales bacterium]
MIAATVFLTGKYSEAIHTGSNQACGLENLLEQARLPLAAVSIQMLEYLCSLSLSPRRFTQRGISY